MNLRKFCSKLFSKPATVVQFRAGAPDKSKLFHHANIKYHKVNGYNMADMDKELIDYWLGKGYWLLPADEGDIKIANSLYGDQSHIMLPQVKVSTPEGSVLKVIPYSYVNKDSGVYKHLEEKTGMKYLKSKIMTVEEFEDFVSVYEDKPYEKIFEECAIKTTTGSGSRGVLVCSKYAFEHKMEYYHEYATYEDLQRIISFAKSEVEGGRDCKIMIQDLIPTNLVKVNCDFCIRNGKLLGYRWDIPEHGSNFTNWNWLTVVHNIPTDRWMKNITDYLINDCGIENAIMNFEAYQTTDLLELYMVEFNWRYSNSAFTSQAFNIDMVSCYVHNTPFSFPVGETSVLRYWQAATRSSFGYEIDKGIKTIERYKEMIKGGKSK